MGSINYLFMNYQSKISSILNHHFFCFCLNTPTSLFPSSLKTVMIRVHVQIVGLTTNITVYNLIAPNFMANRAFKYEKHISWKLKTKNEIQFPVRKAVLDSLHYREMRDIIGHKQKSRHASMSLSYPLTPEASCLLKAWSVLCSSPM